MSILKTNWNNEYSTQESLINEIIYPVSWNYEIAPNKENGITNIVSKHCIIPKKVVEEKKLDLSAKYFSIDFLPHFNQ